MGKCVTILPPMGVTIHCPNATEMAGKPFGAGIVCYNTKSVDGFGTILTAGAVWVKREDLDAICKHGLRFVALEDGDELFEETGVGRYRWCGKYEDGGKHPDMVVISLDGKDITDKVAGIRAEMDEKKKKGMMR